MYRCESFWASGAVKWPTMHNMASRCPQNGSKLGPKKQIGSPFKWIKNTLLYDQENLFNQTHIFRCFFVLFLFF